MISHFLVPTIITIILINGSSPTKSLNACLGKSELKFLRSYEGSDLCTLESASPILKIGCWMAFTLYFILSTNLAESYMLYHCFIKINLQTNDSKRFSTIHSYIRRRKWVNSFMIVFLWWSQLLFWSKFRSKIGSDDMLSFVSILQKKFR